MAQLSEVGMIRRFVTNMIFSIVCAFCIEHLIA